MEIKVSELLKGFEGDMVHDCHGPIARFERSSAQKQLVELGRAALGPIVEYLKNRAPFDELETAMELPRAYALLLNQIGIKLGKKELAEAPQKLADLDGWREWAEKHKAA